MLGNTLSAPELLRNRGIRSETLEKWKKNSETLPLRGQKQFQPNNSWLQLKQIEEGLKNRKDLLGIERVERTSQLAAAEWLSQESRALVTKKSGQEWANFGFEEDSKLYLIPEEALLLVELNCLELTWKGVALSIQQAYAALLESDRSECSLEEYRVYSHLARQGYRLQRFHYQGDSVGCNRASLKRKIDQGGTSGLTAIGAVGGRKTGNNVSRKAIKKPRICGEWSENSGWWRSVEKGDSNRAGKRMASEIYDNGTLNLPGPSSAQVYQQANKPAKESKVQVISNETVLGDLKIIRQSSQTTDKQTKFSKQMPKQGSAKNGANADESWTSEMDTWYLGKEKADKNRAVRHEVIEISDDEIEMLLSDDEIEMLPRKLSRMELLNLIPNVLSESYKFEPISKRYLPRNVSLPEESVAKLSRWKTRLKEVKRQNSDRSPRQRENYGTPAPVGPMPTLNLGVTLTPIVNRARWLTTSILDRVLYGSGSFRSSNGYYREQIQFASGFYRGQQAANNHASFQQQSILSNPSCFYWRNNPARRNFPRLQKQRSPYDYEKGCWKSSFKVVPGAASWSETKETWLREKTIRIDDDDEEPENPIAEEVEVVMQPPKPLVGPANATSISQVYKRLQMIKGAPPGAAKRPIKSREIDYRISYNLYSTGQPFKKTNPGAPMYRIVVFRLEDTPFIELADVAQLQLDAKETPIVLACVSRTSVTFAEFGQVAIPDIQTVST